MPTSPSAEAASNSDRPLTSGATTTITTATPTSPTTSATTTTPASSSQAIDVLPSVMNTGHVNKPLDQQQQIKKEPSPGKESSTTKNTTPATATTMESSSSTAPAGTNGGSPSSPKGGDQARQATKRKEEPLTAVPARDVEEDTTASSSDATNFNIIYQCDNCFKSPLVGTRFRCNQCAEYDLCKDCMENRPSHNPSHTFQQYPIDETPFLATYIALTNQFKKDKGEALPSGGTVSPLLAGLQTSNTSSASNAGATAGAASATTAASDAPVRPPRRSASTGKGPLSTFENSIERMDEILAKCSVGPIPASHTSSTIASQFIDLYQTGLVAMERHKKGRAQEQLNARIAMALVGIPQRARRGVNFVARSIPQPVEEDVVRGILASLVAQLMALDSDHVFHKIKAEFKSRESATGTEMLDLEKLKHNVERESYFRRVESPVQALPVFHKHLMRILGHPERFSATQEQANKIDLLSRQAFDEIRDALGLPNSSPSEAAVDVTMDLTSNESQSKGKPGSLAQASNSVTSGGSSTKAGALTTSGPTMNSTSISAAQPSPTGASSKDPMKKKKKRDREEMESSRQTKQDVLPASVAPSQASDTLTPAGPHVPQQFPVAAAPVQMVMAPFPTAQLQAHGLAAPISQKQSTQQMGASTLSFGKSNGVTESDADLRAQMKRLREDLDDAHSRIDVLVHLLREKIANPLIRGLGPRRPVSDTFTMLC